MSEEEVTATEAARLTGLSLRTITTRLAKKPGEPGAIPGAYRVQPPGEPWQWRIPREALDELKRSSTKTSSDLEGRLAELERRIAALEASSRGAAEASRHVRTPPPTLEPSESALSALQGHSVTLASFAKSVGVPATTARAAADAGRIAVHKDRTLQNSPWLLDEDERAAFTEWARQTYAPRRKDASHR